MKKTAFAFSFDTIRAVQGFQVLRQGSNILLAILLAKSSLGLQGIGQYELLTYIGATLSFFWLTGALQSFLTVFPGRSEADQQKLLFTSYLFFVFMALLTMALMLVGKEWIQNLLVGGAKLRYYELFTIYIAINLPTFLLEHFLQLYQRPMAILGFGLISFGGQVLVVGLPVWLGWGLYWAFVGMVLLAVVKHLILLAFLFKHARPYFDQSQLIYWLYLALPLAGYALIGGFSQAFDGWLVNWSSGGDEGLFASWRYGARELPFSLALLSGLGNGLLPGFSTKLDETLAETRIRTLRLQHFLFPLAIVLTLTSNGWFPLVFSPQFSSSIPIFNLFLLLIISRVVLSRTIMTGLKENGFVLWVSVIELGINVGLSFLFVKSMGLLGIALGTVIAYTFEKVAHASRLFWKYRIRPSEYIHLGWLTFYSLLLLAAFAWTIWGMN